MPSFRTGTVVTLLEARPGLQRVEVDLGARSRARVRADPAHRSGRARRPGGGEHDRGRARARHRRLARRALEPRAGRRGPSPAPATSSRAATRASRPTSAAPRSTSRRWPRSTRSTACPSSRPRCTASCPRSRRRSRTRARRPPRVRDDRRRRAAARRSPTSSPTLRAAGLLDATITAGTRSAATTKRSRCTRRSRWRATSPAPTPRSWSWVRASSAPTPGSASPAWRWARSSTPPHALGGVADRVPARVVRRRARPGTRGCRTTARPRCASRRVNVRWSRSRRCREEQAVRLRADLAAAGIDRRHELGGRRRARRRSRCSRAHGLTSRRWAGPRPTIPRCSKPAAAAAGRSPRAWTRRRDAGA